MCKIGTNSMRLFPRLGAMTLDSPERVKYFGLRNFKACGICRNRWGRSNTRKATCHRPAHVQQQYTIAHASTTVNGRRKRARDELYRHGLDWKKQCLLPDHAKRCLVHIEEFGPRLYGGLCRYERMHVYFTNYCTYLMDEIVPCVDRRHHDFVHRVVLQCHQFRDPHTGSGHPRLPYLLKMNHLTAERRVRGIFYWAHVLGLKAQVIHAEVRVHVQLAVAYLQLILIALRGHRPYTQPELVTIFEDVGRQFFSHLERIAEYNEMCRLKKQRIRHRRNPQRHKPPIPFRPRPRFLLNH